MDERLRQLLNQGKELYDKHEYDRAEPYLKQVVMLSPGFADVHNMLGVVYHGQGRFTQAQESFEQALRINPAYTEAALNLSVTYNDLGKYREAKEVYAQALAASRSQPRHLDPYARGKIANMHSDIGDAYYGLGLLDEAVREYRHALELAPHYPDIRTRLAQVLRDQGKLDDAVRELEKAKNDAPRYMPARVHLGLAFFSLGRREAAIAEWESVLTEDPNNKSCRMYLQMLRAQ